MADHVGVDVHYPMPFIPTGMKMGSHGLKPSSARVINLIDTTDPAFPRVAALLHEMGQAGIELDEIAITMAIKLGKHRAQSVLTSTPPPGRAFAVDDIGAGSIVYYIRRGDLIKIGTTKNPKQRFRELHPDEILACEPGGRSLEVLRHRQFSHLREQGEYFHTGDDLNVHVEQMRRMHGDPDPSWRAMATGNRSSGLIPPAADRPLPDSAETCNTAQAARRLGIKRNTAQGWVRRGKIQAVARDQRGNPVYFLDHFRDLMQQSRAYRADM